MSSPKKPIKVRYILAPLCVFLAALVVFVVLITSAINATQSHEHLDHQQIAKVERYIDKQVSQSKACSAEAVQKSVSDRKKCEKTINGILKSIAPVELQLLARALQPYLQGVK